MNFVVKFRLTGRDSSFFVCMEYYIYNEWRREDEESSKNISCIRNGTVADGMLPIDGNTSKISLEKTKENLISGGWTVKE